MAKKTQKSVKQIEVAIRARKAKLVKYQDGARAVKVEIGQLTQDLRNAKANAKANSNLNKTTRGKK